MKTGSNYPLGEFYYSERISVYDRVIFISNWPGLRLRSKDDLQFKCAERYIEYQPGLKAIIHDKNLARVA